jgi:hypothetical protein
MSRREEIDGVVRIPVTGAGGIGARVSRRGIDRACYTRGRIMGAEKFSPVNRV